jgi:hypothetical protein
MYFAMPSSEMFRRYLGVIADILSPQLHADRLKSGSYRKQEPIRAGLPSLGSYGFSVNP